MTVKTIETVFTCDNKRLKGVLSLPRRGTPPLVIGSHGLEGSKESAKQTALAELLPRAGIAFFRFDHRGCGESDGTFEFDTSLDKRAEDLISGLDHILSLKLTDRRFAFFGSSLGGAACIEAWHRLKAESRSPRGMVVCAAPVKSATIEAIPFKGNEHRPALPLDFFKENLLFDLTAKTVMLDTVLVFHGDRDRTVPVENGYTIYRNAKEPKRVIIQKNGDHRMSNPQDQQEFDRESTAWFKSCLER
ncbi:MAG: alpha/beta hydrolase [Desulfobacteraceae bacterium]